MGTILSFSSRRLSKATPRRAPHAGPAEIVIFSGARIERPQPAPSVAAQAQPGAEDTPEPAPAHSTGMLLAALALMLGIALRRWGADRQ